MARVTVEDCIDKVDSPYQLVLVAKERVTQLNSGTETTLPRDNDKNTVVALREIAGEKIKVDELFNRKGEKFITIDNPSDEYDGGSRGKVKLKGKRGVGWVNG